MRGCDVSLLLATCASRPKRTFQYKHAAASLATSAVCLQGKQTAKTTRKDRLLSLIRLTHE